MAVRVGAALLCVGLAGFGLHRVFIHISFLVTTSWRRRNDFVDPAIHHSGKHLHTTDPVANARLSTRVQLPIRL